VKPAAWIVYSKDRRFVRACWTVQPDANQIEAAEFDGDLIVPIYQRPAPLTDAQIDAVTDAQWGGEQLSPYAAYRAYARAIERALFEGE
jgi:hypothetical protein